MVPFKDNRRETFCQFPPSGFWQQVSLGLHFADKTAEFGPFFGSHPDVVIC